MLGFRPASLAVALLALSAGPAFGSPGASPDAPTSAPAPASTPAADDRESPAWFTESTVFSRAPSIPENHPLAERGLGNVPIVGEDARGRRIDVRTGRVLSDAEADATEAANALGGDGPAVTILHAETSGSTGIDRFGFKDGSRELAKGKLGSISAEAGNAWGYGAAGAAIGEGGFRAGGVAGGTLTLVGLSGATETVGFGKKDSRVKGVAEGMGYAMVGADGSVSGTVRVGTDALAIGAQAGAFVGASAGVSAIGELDVAGVAVRVIVGATAGYGLGGDAAAFFKVDWANLSVRIGGNVLAALGPSAGASIDVEISVAGLLKNLGVTTALSKGVKKVAGFLKNAALAAAAALGVLDRTSADGVSVARDASTTVSATSTPPTNPTSAAAGAGIAR